MSVDFFNIPKFWHQKATGIISIGTSFQEVVTMTTPVLAVGLYMLYYSFEVDFNGERSAIASFRMTGTYGAVTEFDISAPTVANKLNRFYGFPKEHAGGAILFGMDFKQTGVAQFDVDFIDVIVARVS